MMDGKMNNKLQRSMVEMEKKKYVSNFTAPEPYSLPYSEEIKRGELTKARESIPCNKEILKIMEILKKEVIELIEMLSTMKLWLRLSRPKFEDGNNFGVDVQNDVLTSLTTGAASAKNMLQQFHQYYVRRASFMRRCEKYPKVEDPKKDFGLFPS